MRKNWIVAVVTGIFVPASIVFAGTLLTAQPSGPVVINCAVEGSCNNVLGVPSEESSFGAYAPVQSQETDFTSLNVTDDLTVGDSSAITGDVTIGKTLTVTGTSTFSGIVLGAPRALNTAISSSATSTACSILNNTGITRVVIAAGVVDTGTAASTGAVLWTIGTSTYPGVSSTSPWNTLVSITRASGTDVITTTSSLMSAYSTWANGEYINFETNTSTNAGYCKVMYY